MIDFMFASDYYFLEPGIQRVSRLFTEAMERKKKVKDLTSQYTELSYCKTSNSWVIKAPDETEGLEVYKVLHGILTKLISSEIGDDFDDDDGGGLGQQIESELIQREGLPCSAHDGGLEGTLETLSKARGWEFASVWHSLPIEELKVYGEDFLDRMIPGDSLSTLEMLTETKLTANHDLQVINIQSRSEEAMNRAICKLDIMRKSCKIQTFLVHNVFYTENVGNFQLCALPFQEMKKKMVQMTLSDYSKLIDERRRQSNSNYNQEITDRNAKIKRYYTLRCSKWEPVRSVYHLQALKKLVPAVAEDMTQIESTIWKNYVYHNKGNEAVNRVGQLADGSHDGTSLREVTDKTEMIVDWAQGLPDVTQMIDGMVHGNNSFATPELRGGSENAAFAISVDGQSTNILANTPDQHHLSLLSGSPKKHQSLQTLSLLDGSPTKHPNLQVPLRPTNLPTQTANVDSWTTLQQKDEVSTRSFKPMRQGAACRNLRNENQRSVPVSTPTVSSTTTAQISDPVEHFVDSFRSSMCQLLETMRTWGGEVKLELQFGRICLRKIARQLTDGKMRSPESVLPYLPATLADSRKQVFFTKIVTNLPADAQYLVELKDGQGQPLWLSSLPPKWDVYYEIDCVQVQSNIQFQIRVDAETFKVQVHSLPSVFGAIYGHCVLRNWDFRVFAIGVKDEMSYFEEFAAELRESLCIRLVNQKPNLSFECKHEHGIRPMSVRIRRTLHYPSFDRKATLHVSESQHMFISACTMPETGKTVYQVAPAAAKSMPSDPESVWQEIYITSAEADRAFKDNDKLELGEEVSWTVKRMEQQGVPNTLMRAATIMIQQMDGVGWYNDNGQRPASTRHDDQTTASTVGVPQSSVGYEAPRATQPKGEDFSFW